MNAPRALLFFTLSAAMAALPGSLGCSPPAQAQATVTETQPLVVASRARARVAKVPRTLTYQATVLAARDTVVSAAAGGRVEALLAERGDAVLFGAPLARLRDAEARAASEGAVAAAAGAEARLAGARDPARSPEVVAAAEALAVATDARRRAESLVAQGSVSEQELVRLRSGEETARAQRDAALAQARAASALIRQSRAAVRQSRAALDDLTLRAPYEGVVLERLVEVGEIVAPGGPVLRLVDASSLRLTFEVAQHEAGRIALGQEIEIDGGRARISRLAPGLTGEAHARVVEARIDAVPAGLLPGARVQVRVLLDERDDVVVVPRRAVQNEGGVARVWVVRDGRVTARLPEVLRAMGDDVLVREGIADGEEVVLDPSRDLHDGRPVAP